MPAGLCYATVWKRREKGRVVEVKRTLVFGLACVLAVLLSRSKVSKQVNTALVERNNGTQRRQNGRQHRKTYGFSKDGETHEAATYFIGYRLQLLLGSEDLGGQRLSGAQPAAYAGDGGRAGRPCLVPPGMAD